MAGPSITPGWEQEGETLGDLTCASLLVEAGASESLSRSLWSILLSSRECLSLFIHPGMMPEEQESNQSWWFSDRTPGKGLDPGTL